MTTKLAGCGSLILLAVLGFGCGGGGGATATVSSFCAQKAEKECGTAKAGVAASCGVTVAACTTKRAAACMVDAAAQMSATRPFRSENIGTCLSKTSAAYTVATVTPALRAAMADACARVFSGSNKGAATDAMCTDTYECAPNLVCDKAICAKKSSSSTNDFCNDPGASCPAAQYCTGAVGTMKCTDKKISGAACDAVTPCLDTLRCTAAGLCADRVTVGGACTADSDCGPDAPYCDPYNGSKCYQGFKPSVGTNECVAFGAVDTGGAGGTAGGVGGTAGGLGGTVGGLGGAGGAAI